MLKRQYPRFLTLFVVMMLMLSACGDQNNPSQGGQTDQGTPGVVTDTNGTGGATGGGAGGGEGMIAELDGGAFGGGNNPQLNYNPFSPNNLLAGYFYEPLMVMNNYSCQPVPWLATDYKWNDPQTLVFTIRDGVKWSDGQAFTPDDVVFTMNLLKKVPAFDQQGLWKALDSVTADGNVVTFKFKEPSVPMFTRVLSQVILPKHIWEPLPDPTTFTNEQAVGTGPFMPSTFNGQLLEIKRNPDYWQADKIKVEKIQFHQSAGGNEVENLKLAKGEYDFNAMFVPNIAKAFVAKDPAHFHYWFPQGRDRPGHEPDQGAVQRCRVPPRHGLRDQPQRNLRQGRIRLCPAGQPDRPDRARPEGLDPVRYPRPGRFPLRSGEGHRNPRQGGL